jgi:hypothetical protein
MPHPSQHQHLVVTLAFSDHAEMERFKRHVCNVAGTRDWHVLQSDTGRRDRAIVDVIRSALPVE